MKYKYWDTKILDIAQIYNYIIYIQMLKIKNEERDHDFFSF